MQPAIWESSQWCIFGKESKQLEFDIPGAHALNPGQGALVYSVQYLPCRKWGLDEIPSRPLPSSLSFINKNLPSSWRLRFSRRLCDLALSSPHLFLCLPCRRYTVHMWGWVSPSTMQVIFWLVNKLLIIKPVNNILWPLSKNMQWCCIKWKLSWEGEIVLNMSCSEAKLISISKGHLTHYKIWHKNVHEFICVCINILLYAANRRTIFYNTFTVTWIHATIKPLGFKKKVGIIEKSLCATLLYTVNVIVVLKCWSLY